MFADLHHHQQAFVETVRLLVRPRPGGLNQNTPNIGI